VALDSQRAKSIFLAALEQTGSQRQALLDEACAGDPELHQRVERLLQAHERPDSLLAEERPAGAATAASRCEPAAGGRAADELSFLTPGDRAGVLGRLGHYDILEVVGRGGMGIVLRAFDDTLHRVVAIKVMAQHLATNATARIRFTREAQAQAAISHDHVVTIHAVDEANGLPYLVMQYVAGRSLQQRLDRDGLLKLQEILRIGMQIASGLTAAHAQGLVHRDIKPANILLENGVERVKITDFGLARAASEASLTQSGMVAGTPQYMSPEQAEGKPIDQRTDLFSLGSVLYAMCTGRPPFRAPTMLAVLKQVCEETPQPIRESNPEAPPWLVESIAKLHAKDPAQRFQTAADVAQLLGRRLAELQQPSAGPNLPGPAGEPQRLWPKVAAALLLLGGGLGVLEAVGVTRLVPALHRAVDGQALPSGGQQPVTDPVAPQVEARPFVILARGGGAEQQLDTLAEAVRLAGDGDTIEVRGNGPFHQGHMVIFKQALRIRAGDGLRPVFSVGPREKPDLGGIIVSHSPLVVEGLEFQQTTPPDTPQIPSRRGRIIVGYGPLYVANCRFVFRTPLKASYFPHNSVLATESRHCELCNCQIMGELGLNLSYCPSTLSVLRNNVIMSMGPPLLARFTSGTNANQHLQLRRNTLVGLMKQVDMFAPEPTGPPNLVGEPPKPIRIAASGNIFTGREGLAPFAVSTATEKPSESLQKRVSWTGDHNLFAPSARLSLWNPAVHKYVTAGANLNEWKKFWDCLETGSVEGLPEYHGGNIRARFADAPESITSEDFRLLPGSAGSGAGTNKEDLGADVDLVGPGPAYERWKKTPEYKEWLKVTDLQK
jgi:hypothetical protein